MLPPGKTLPYEDGIPLESDWHRDAMNLLISILRYFWGDRDVYIAGNMFVYFDPDQVKNRNFRGPDFFVVKGVREKYQRNSWVVWEEDGLTPDFVLELASESTARFDVTGKKDIYEQMLQTPDYMVYNPATDILQGWRLVEGTYQPLEPNEHGWLWSQELELWVGVGEYQFLRYSDPVRTLRFFEADGQLVLSKDEAEAQQAKAEAQRAEAEAQRAEEADQRAEEADQRAKEADQRAKAIEAENARLRALLNALNNQNGQQPPL